MSIATWEEAGAPLRIAIDAPLEEPAARPIRGHCGACARGTERERVHLPLRPHTYRRTGARAEQSSA